MKKDYANIFQNLLTTFYHLNHTIIHVIRVPSMCLIVDIHKSLDQLICLGSGSFIGIHYTHNIKNKPENTYKILR